MSLFDQVAFVLLGLVAMIYSSAGLGGGSSYLAIMALMNLPFETYPTLALFCNLIVVTSSAIRFIKNKLVDWKNILPWISLSVPMAYLGGLIHLPEFFFLVLLATLLLFSGVRIVLNQHHTSEYRPSFFIKLSIGAILGIISGLVGIGGGIFLSPLMTWWKLERAKNIAITTTLFIFFNSLAALLAKIGSSDHLKVSMKYWPVLLVVFLGGQIGNRWCVYKATDKELTKAAGLLSILASLTLIYKIFKLGL